jgi:hypothetical protein
MNIQSVLQYVRKTYDPKRYMNMKLSAFPTLVKRTIFFGQQEGKTDAQIIESLEKLATKFEKQIEETGFNV